MENIEKSQSYQEFETSVEGRYSRIFSEMESILLEDKFTTVQFVKDCQTLLYFKDGSIIVVIRGYEPILRSPIKVEEWTLYRNIPGDTSSTSSVYDPKSGNSIRFNYSNKKHIVPNDVASPEVYR